MIFEGVSTGQCVITFGFSTNNQAPVAMSRPFYLNLKKVTDLYEHWTVGDNTTTEWYEITNRASRTPDSGGYGSPQKKEDLDYILFVHGWRMQPWERRAFASTAYKRMWQLGYRGRFGLYSWPTDYTANPGDLSTQFSRQNYDRSEQRAWNSSWGLWRLLIDLNKKYTPSYRVRLMAHSMGNIVASEALRFRGLNPNKPPLVQAYIASQAASVAHAYDAVNPEVVRTISTPEVYANYPRGNSNQPYFTGMGNAVAIDPLFLKRRIFNFHNSDDYALNYALAWPLNQTAKPDIGWGYSHPEWWRNLLVTTPLFLSVDQWEIFAHIASAKSKALGCAEDSTHHIQGEIGFSVDLHNPNTFNFTSSTNDHSAQFNSINQKRRTYWWQVLSSSGLTGNLPNP